MEQTITTTGRSAQTIAAEIRIITKQAQQLMLSAAIEIGRRLVEAKEMVPYGEWGDYLKTEVAFSASSANNFMRLYEEYGSEQESLFGAKSQALANLTYTKALRLLAIPADEREDFAEENDVSELSTRELDKLIRERDAAKAEAEALRHTQATDAANLTQYKQAAKEAAAKAAQLKSKLDAAQKTEKDLKGKLAEAQKQAPSANAMEQLRKEAAAKAEAETAERVRKELQAQIAKAERRAADAEAAQRKAEEAALAAARSGKLQSKSAVEFATLFTQVQSTIMDMLGKLGQVAQEDPALADKLRAAVAALAGKMEQEAQGNG